MNTMAPPPALMTGADYRESLRRYRPRVSVDGRWVDSVFMQRPLGEGDASRP